MLDSESEEEEEEEVVVEEKEDEVEVEEDEVEVEDVEGAGDGDEGVQDEAQQEEPPPFAIVEHDAEQSANCLLCRKRTLGGRDDALWVQCDRCRRWCHAECAGLDEATATAMEEYACPKCAKRILKEAATDRRREQTIGNVLHRLIGCVEKQVAKEARVAKVEKKRAADEAKAARKRERAEADYWERTVRKAMRNRARTAEVQRVLDDLVDHVVEVNRLEAKVLAFIPGELWGGPPPILAELAPACTALVAIPSATRVATTISSAGLPPGWGLVRHHAPNSVYYVYHGPEGHKVRSKLQAWKLYNEAQGQEVGLGTRMDVTHVKERNDGDDDVDDDEVPFRQVEQELEVIGLGSEYSY